MERRAASLQSGDTSWPSDPQRLTDALSVAMGGYDLYQAFAGFSADDLVAKKRFEEKRAPQYMGGLGQIYASRPFAAGEVPSFADCIAHRVYYARRQGWRSTQPMAKGIGP